MKTEKEVRDKIKDVYEGQKHILERYPQTAEINTYVAIEQCSTSAYLDALYWVIGEKRPRMKCDDFKNMNK